MTNNEIILKAAEELAKNGIIKTKELHARLEDGDQNLTSLIFEDGDTKVMATGKDPECSKDDENYFDNEENIKAFLKTAEIEEVQHDAKRIQSLGRKTRGKRFDLYLGKGCR